MCVVDIRFSEVEESLFTKELKWEKIWPCVPYSNMEEKEKNYQTIA